MGIPVVVNERIRDSDDLQFAEKAIDLHKAGKTWECIDLLLQAWAKKSPSEVKAQKIVINGYRQSLKDKRFGQTEGGHDIQRRFILSFPQTLRIMIGAVFKSDLKIDNKFFAEFARRYPFFMVPTHL